MKDTTKTVRDIASEVAADPDRVTMDKAGPVYVHVETRSGKIRRVTGAYFYGGILTLRTEK